MNHSINKAILLIASVLLIASIIASLPMPGEGRVDLQDGGDPTAPMFAYVPHSIIRINNNAELALAASSGSGTAASPYIISGYDIDGSDGICIFIGNTTAHVTVRNCYLHDQSYVSEPYNVGAGVMLYNVENAIIQANSFYSLSAGVNLCSSTNNIIVNNLVSSVGHGIMLDQGSDGNIVANNVCNGVSFGIALEGSDVNVIENNTCNGNVMGIFAGDSNHNTISNNTIRNNIQYGLFLQSSIGNSIYGNVLLNNNGTSSVYDASHDQAYDSGSNVWNSPSYGNYWGDWNSPDANGDGIVDVAYLISGGLNQDSRPLTDASLTITTPSSMEYVITETCTVSGTAVDGRDISSIIWHNLPSGTSGACSGTTAWSAAVPLTVGNNIITVTMTDADGYKYSDSVTVIQDITAPSVEITSPAAGSCNTTGSVTVTWTGDEPSDFDRYEVRLNDGEWVTVSGHSRTFDLGDGSHTVIVRAYDDPGNYGEASVDFIVDTEAPTISIQSPGHGSYHNANSATILWAASDEGSGIDHYNLSVNGGAWITVSTLSHTLTGLSDGSYTVVVSAYDKLLQHTETEVTFIVDTVSPAISITSPADDSYNNTGSVLVIWTGDDTNGIDHYIVRVDSGAPVTVAPSAVSYMLNGLSDGMRTINVTAVDEAGNVAYDEVTIGVSVVGPVITTTPASPIYTNDDWVEVLLHMTDAIPMTTGNMSIYANGVLVDHGTLWGMDGQTSHGEYKMLYLDSGVNEFYFTANDTAGNSRTIKVIVYRDITPPTISITSPASGSFNNTGSVSLSWNGHDSVGIDRYEIFVNGGKVATVDAGVSSYALTLGEGHDEIEVYAYDLAGGSAHASITVTVDLTGPIVAITSPTNGAYNTTGSVTVVWQGANPLSGIAHYLVSIDDGDAISVSASTLSHAFTGLADGSYTVVVKAVDNAGNVDTDTVEFVVDSVAPTIEILSPSNNSFKTTSSVTIVWTASDVTSGIAYYNMSVNGGSWTTVTGMTSVFDLEDGSYTVVVRAYDEAGHYSEAAASFIVDTTVPTVVVAPTGDEIDIDAVIVVEFSEMMNLSSVEIVVSNSVDGDVVFVENNMTFTPNALLEYNRDYTVIVSGKDLAGNAVSKEWTFSTMVKVGDIAGRIVDKDGNALVNVTITLSNGLTATTNATGHFVFEDVDIGSYTVSIVKDGYLAASANATVIADVMDDLGSIAMTATPSNDATTPSSDGTLLIVVAIVAIAGIAAVGLLFMKKRPKVP